MRLLLVAGVAALLVVPATVWAADAFNDVPDGNVHHAAVAAIRNAGITQGCAQGRHCPDAGVRRDQMASFMDRLGALVGQTPVNAGLQATLARVTRSDVDGLDTLRFEAMNVQVVNGTGSTDGEPDGAGQPHHRLQRPPALGEHRPGG